MPPARAHAGEDDDIGTAGGAPQHARAEALNEAQPRLLDPVADAGRGRVDEAVIVGGVHDRSRLRAQDRRPDALEAVHVHHPVGSLHAPQGAGHDERPPQVERVEGHARRHRRAVLVGAVRAPHRQLPHDDAGAAGPRDRFGVGPGGDDLDAVALSCLRCGQGEHVRLGASERGDEGALHVGDLHADIPSGRIRTRRTLRGGDRHGPRRGRGRREVRPEPHPFGGRP